MQAATILVAFIRSFKYSQVVVELGWLAASFASTFLELKEFELLVKEPMALAEVGNFRV